MTKCKKNTTSEHKYQRAVGFVEGWNAAKEHVDCVEDLDDLDVAIVDGNHRCFRVNWGSPKDYGAVSLIKNDKGEWLIDSELSKRRVKKVFSKLVDSLKFIED